jgi:type IV secretory pathway VirB3-like protein
MITPTLLGGVPHMAAVLNGTLTAVLFRATFKWQVLVIGVGLHLIARQITKRDVHWVAVTKCYWRTKRHYAVS